MSRFTRRQQIELLRQLRDMYLDHMEGEDFEQFKKWEGLFVAADMILKAMQSDGSANGNGNGHLHKDQLDFFGGPMFRQTDHDTSKEAAREVRVNRDRRLALVTLAKNGPITDYEMEAITGRQKNSIGKRRTELYQNGYVDKARVDGKVLKRPGPSGKNCIVWELTGTGVAVYRTLTGG